MQSITRAIEVFVRGFCFTRSLSHPYLPEQIGPLWVMRDAPRKRADKYRGEEWVAYGIAPPVIDQTVRSNARGRFSICVICEDDDAQATVRAEFKQMNYRLVATEPLMIHSLAQLPHFDSPALIERVTTPEMAERLAKATRARPLLPEYLAEHSPLRQYVAQINGEIVGWVRGMTVNDGVEKATWCSDMAVKAEFRRRGIARSMLCRMLADDRDHGAQNAVLLASHTGAKLYPVVGYEQIGTLLLFAPKG